MSNWGKVVNFILPPDGEPHDRRWYAWAGVSITCLWFFMWWSIGMVPAFGAGFAKAEDAQLNTQLILESRLLQVKQKQCLSNDQESKTYYTQEIIRLKNLYRDKIGFDYNEPPCSAVTITAVASDDE